MSDPRQTLLACLHTYRERLSRCLFQATQLREAPQSEEIDELAQTCEDLIVLLPRFSTFATSLQKRIVFLLTGNLPEQLVRLEIEALVLKDLCMHPTGTLRARLEQQVKMMRVGQQVLQYLTEIVFRSQEG